MVEVDTAMILAAGLGTRMRPITDNIAKPMVEVGGRSLIHRAIDRFVDAGIRRLVINLHHKADLMRAHVAARDDVEILFSDETELLLETGGGVAKALPLLGDKPFFVANSDMIWGNGPRDALRRMAWRFDPNLMDSLLMLVPTVNAQGYDGPGDFEMLHDSRVSRRKPQKLAPFLFGGVQLLHPRLFRDHPEGPFSFNLLFDRALANNRLFGLRHDGYWIHVGTPEWVGLAEDLLHRLVPPRVSAS